MAPHNQMGSGSAVPRNQIYHVQIRNQQSLSQPWLQRPGSRGPGDRLLSFSCRAVKTRTHLRCVRSEMRATATTSHRSDQGRKDHAEAAQVRRRAHRGMRALGADSRRRQHRCETHRSRRQAHRAPQQPLTTPIEQRLATLLAQKTDADPTLCIRPKYSVKKLSQSDTILSTII